MTKSIFLLIPFFLFFANIFAQETVEQKIFKVHIGEHALMCPNLGPKLKVNIAQIGGKILMFDIENSNMLLKIPKENKEASKASYISTIIELTGYPKSLVEVIEINTEEKEKILKKYNASNHFNYEK